MRQTCTTFSALVLIASTCVVNAQEGYFYTTDKGSAGVVKAAPPPVYPRDPNLPNYYSLGSKPSPPPITFDEINTPGYWQREKDLVLGKDANGMNLHDRGLYCSALERKISQYAEISMQWLNDHDLWFSPSFGYISHGIVMSESRAILTYTQVALRDMRYVKHDGAVIQHCDDIANFAFSRMSKLLEKYPEDPGWLERVRN
ncbi:hypothetical protein [Magnetospirillum sp. 15-1]|uniref:hypothetical protein n=1 Tax=Magnetospirillum sp. 15-1 TaxID=1979370 RepID=UPI000BBBF2A1|nr:hypothetical protein [Magnetospirillum sp. 15-1]